MLELHEVCKTFPGPDGEVQALARVSFSLDAGEFVTAMGPSGCGKTTLLLVAGALLSPSSGTVRIGGRDAYALPPNQRSMLRAEEIGFVFQQFHLVPYLSVLENVLVPSVAYRSQDAVARAEQLIDHFDLRERINHVPAQLSTGERQRTALARALLNRPKVLLADEPTGNLDEENSRRVLEALREFARDGGAVLMVTHESSALSYAGRVLKLQRGRLVEG